ncbi:MAG: hypothetical protein R3321_00120 [Nitrososphaeraceae archaeon]|nr:hypothetical protein [Nitrososphaeraceae archaeon]
MRIKDLLDQLDKYKPETLVNIQGWKYIDMDINCVPRRELKDCCRTTEYMRDNPEYDEVACIKSSQEPTGYYCRMTNEEFKKCLSKLHNCYTDVVLCHDDRYCSPSIYTYLDVNGEIRVL